MGIKQLNNGRVEISTDAAHVIRKKGDKDPTDIRRRRINADEIDQWEEVTVEDQPPYSQSEYDAKVAELIHERYSADRETSLINNMLDGEPTEEHAAEYREYQRFRAECKLRAKDPALYVREEPEAPDVAPDAAEAEDQLPENGEGTEDMY